MLHDLPFVVSQERATKLEQVAETSPNSRCPSGGASRRRSRIIESTDRRHADFDVVGFERNSEKTSRSSRMWPASAVVGQGTMDVEADPENGVGNSGPNRL